jgi:uncharacterized membrane protein YbhN (UPF0104 family)
MSNFKYAEHVRGVALVVLIAVTGVGVWTFVTGDWTDVIEYWREHWKLIPLLALFSVIDVALEAVAWMWLYTRFRIRAFDRGGFMVYLSGRAGLLMPAQLGRLIRPDAMARMGRAPFAQCMKAETLLLVLDGISVLALLAALFAYKFYPLAALPVGIAVTVILLFIGNRLADLFAHTHLTIEKSFWWTWSTMAIILVNLTGWIAHGLALFVVVAGLPGAMTLWDALMFAPGSAVLGTSTGLPGGIGVTEGILGASLRFRSVPAEHLAIVVAAFRLITFWIWIPIGWLALLTLKRQNRGMNTAEAGETS